MDVNKLYSFLGNNFLTYLMTMFIAVHGFAQEEKEVPPPFNIKTVSFVESGGNVLPYFKMGEYFVLQFDDLYGTQADYYYEVVHCDYNWKPTNIAKSEYITNFDNLRIENVANSANTLQGYSHYELGFPNKYNRFLISGNYIIKILGGDSKLVFSRKIIIYEELVNVSSEIMKSNYLNDRDTKQVVEFRVGSNQFLLRNPMKNVKILLLKNGNFADAKKNIYPQYIIANDLYYKNVSEIQFYGGNEFLHFDNKDIKVAANNISKVDYNSQIYSSYLFTNDARANFPYSFSKDVNGNFVVNNFYSDNSSLEADYAWVYFSLSAPNFYPKNGQELYVTGMFNNYSLSPEFKMDYNKKNGLFEKAILIKQGFVNFQYTLADLDGNYDNENAVDGNFWQTENNYDILVYYKADDSRYDRVIGKGSASSFNSLH